MAGLSLRELRRTQPDEGRPFLSRVLASEVRAGRVERDGDGRYLIVASAWKPSTLAALASLDGAVSPIPRAGPAQDRHQGAPAEAPRRPTTTKEKEE
jgi:hypothetical protein